MNKVVPIDSEKIIKILDDMLSEKDRFTEEEIEALNEIKQVFEAFKHLRKE